MAARLNPRHSDLVVRRIRTSQLINRLQDNALGKIALTAEQIRSATFLIERTLAKAEAPKDLHLSGAVAHTIAWPLPKSPLDQ